MNQIQKTAVVFGAGGFIGSHMVKRLKSEGYWVRGADIKFPEYSISEADDFILGDLRDISFVKRVMQAPCLSTFNEVYQFAADMGGAGFIFTGMNDADIMHNSALINLNVLKTQRSYNQDLGINKTKIFYSSSACIYPEYNQMNNDSPNCVEDSAYPAAPDSEYGWEKLFSERLYLAYYHNYHIPVAIARYHNIFGPEGVFDGGREKAPAAICRKVALVVDGGVVDVWGDGQQTRSFLLISECIEGTRRLMKSDFVEPVNIGSDEMISINNLVCLVAKIAGKNIRINNISGPLGVRGRNSDNRLIKEKLGWTPSLPLVQGISTTYNWVSQQVQKITK